MDPKECKLGQSVFLTNTNPEDIFFHGIIKEIRPYNSYLDAERITVIFGDGKSYDITSSALSVYKTDRDQ